MGGGLKEGAQGEGVGIEAVERQFIEELEREFDAAISGTSRDQGVPGGGVCDGGVEEEGTSVEEVAEVAEAAD